MGLRPIVVLCPGVHAPSLTQEFLAAIQAQQTALADYWVYPTQDYPAYSSLHLVQFLHDRSATGSAADRLKRSVLFVGFSAGVAAAIGAGLAWQLLGGQVRALIAVDGWGVPLTANFPCHRLSHDYFTHWSSAVLGQGADSFYADPPVAHLDLWRSPHLASGWQSSAIDAIPSQYTDAASFLTALIQRYSEN